jgi:hypothetical protein
MANLVNNQPRPKVISLLQKARERDMAKAVSLEFKPQLLSSEKNSNQNNNFKFPFFNVKVPFQALISVVVLFLLVVGGISAIYLSQMSQDVRQQASGCTYWNGEPAVEGAHDNRGGIDQVCKNGYWSNPNSVTDSSGNVSESSQNSSNNNPTACTNGQIYCGGCIQGCRAPTQTCNTWIDQECAVQGCGGRGVFPGSGEQCCSGLQQCANGRCDTACSLDNNPVCGGIRAGSDCNNGGTWTCDSLSEGGSGHCEGGAWTQANKSERVTRYACDLSGHIIYFDDKEACENAKKNAQSSIGGSSDISDATELTTVTSERDEDHTVRCNLSETIVYSPTKSVCESLGGEDVSSWVGPCCVGEEYQSLCRPEDRDSVPSSPTDCVEPEPDWIQNCCIDGRYASLCKAEDLDYVADNPLSCVPMEGRECGAEHSTICQNNELLECGSGQQWVLKGSCGESSRGPFVETTCYYVGAASRCTPSVKYLTPGETCSQLGSFSDSDSCDDLITPVVSTDLKLSCFYKTSTSCIPMSVTTQELSECSDFGPRYFNDDNCGVQVQSADILDCYWKADNGGCIDLSMIALNGESCSDRGYFEDNNCGLSNPKSHTCYKLENGYGVADDYCVEFPAVLGDGQSCSDLGSNYFDNSSCNQPQEESSSSTFDTVYRNIKKLLRL